MAQRPIHAQRMVALMVVGWLLLTYPILAVFDRAGTIFGVPAHVVWLFAVWLAMIVVMAVLAPRGGG